MFRKLVHFAISHPNYTDPGIEKTRTTFLNLLLIFAVFIVGFDLYNSITYRFVTLAYVEIAALVILMLTYLLFRRTLSYFLASYLMIGTVAFLSVFSLTVEGYGKEAALFWTASLPLYIFLLLGTRRGVVMSLLVLAGILWSTANAYFAWVPPIFSYDLLVQMVLGYLAISLSIYYFEKMRSRYEVQLTDALKERESLLGELNHQKDRIEISNRELAQKIDEVKEQEQMLITQSRLAAMGEMMSMIAHQWRQPLATMSLMIANHNVKAMLDDKPRDERDRILDEISTTIQYLSETVEDFQTYFKPTNSTESSSVCQILERAVEFTKPRLQLNGITLQNRCNGEYMLQMHSNEMVQVVINILNNAIDAIAQKGSEERLIRIETDETEEHVIIRISDTGGGIPEAIIDRVFEPYFSTKSKNGTGLGLYMAKMIVAKHGDGQIDVENSGRGTKFTLRLAKKPKQ